MICFINPPTSQSVERVGRPVGSLIMLCSSSNNADVHANANANANADAR